MRTLLRLLTASLLALTLGATLAACAPASEPLAITEDTVIIDVRTPDEFTGGHLEGAVNIDVQSADFDSRIAELPTDADYVVYCRSGNRSATAIDRMEQVGFTSLVNGGSLQQAADATGLEIVR